MKVVVREQREKILQVTKSDVKWNFFIVPETPIVYRISKPINVITLTKKHATATFKTVRKCKAFD